MNNPTLKQLHERTSVRAYEDRPLPEEVRRAILEGAIQAPTAGNMALYTILDIREPELKLALSHSCDEQPFIATAPMVLIFCADYHRWYSVFKAQEEATRTPDVGDLFLAQADALIAAQNAVVAAQSLGVGSCYIGDITERFEYHRALLKLPQYVLPTAMVCFGYPTEQQLRREKPRRFQLEELVHENGYDAQKGASMAAMLARQTGKTGEELDGWLRRFRIRKWDSPFSREMSRSCAAMLDAWRSED